MENMEFNEKLRGIVPPSPMQVAEIEKLKAKIQEQKGKPEKLKDEFRRKVRYLLAGIPEGYWGIEWGKCFVDLETKGIVQAFCENFKGALECGQGIIFTGSHGVGKTTLACMTGKQALDDGYTCHYLSIAKIIDIIGATFSDNTAKDRLDTIVERIEVLILDDLGKEYEGVKKQLNPMVTLKLDSLLRERLNRNLITLATTNFTPDDMKRRYGDSVISALRGSCREISVVGRDYRTVRGHEFWKGIGKPV